MAINNFTASGNVGKDCELQVTPNGKNIAKFSLPVTQGYGDHEKTSWVVCKMFGAKAEGLQPYIKKGDQVTVSGEYVTEEWEKDGVKRSQATILVNQIQLAKKSGNTQSEPKQQPKQQQGEPPMDFDDDIPF